MRKLWKGLIGILFVLLLLVSVFSFRGIAQGILEENGGALRNGGSVKEITTDQENSEMMENKEIDDENLEQEQQNQDQHDKNIIPQIDHENEIGNEQVNEIENDSVNEGEDNNGKELIQREFNEKVKVDSKNRKVYLTFDDGPTTLTPMVLEVLKEHNVNASFFMIGQLMESFPDKVLEVYNDGHMVLVHSYSHRYEIYSTFDTFYEDFLKAKEVYRNVLGIHPPPIFRFPGGSSNHSSFKYGGKQFMPKLTEEVRNAGYYYVDWNVESGDTGPDSNNANKLMANVINGSKGKDTVVVLFHDTKRNTTMLEILPQVINYYKESGYEFKTFKDIPRQELDELVRLRLVNKSIVRE